MRDVPPLTPSQSAVAPASICRITDAADADMGTRRHTGNVGRLRWLALGVAALGHGAAIAALMSIQPRDPDRAPTQVLTVNWIAEATVTEQKQATQANKLPPEKGAQQKPRSEPPAEIKKETKKAPAALSKKSTRKPPPAAVHQLMPDTASEPPRGTPTPPAHRAETTPMLSPDRPAPALPAKAARPAQAVPASVPIIAPRFDANYLSNPPPAYPRKSRYLGEEGRVRIKVRVSATGEPLEVRLHASSGFRRLDQAALDAVQRWQFIPARQGQEAVAAWVIVPLTFSLRR